MKALLATAAAALALAPAAAAGGDLRLSDHHVDFGDVAVRSSSTINVSFTLRGDPFPLALAFNNADQGGFTIGCTTTCPLFCEPLMTPGWTCTIAVTLMPVVIGRDTADLYLWDMTTGTNRPAGRISFAGRGV